PDRFGHARRHAHAGRRRLDRACGGHRRDHLDGAGLATQTLAVPGDRRRGGDPAGAGARTSGAAGGGAMNRLRLALQRVPRTVLFAVAGLIQVALIAAMVIDRASILRQGTEITLNTRPVDPRDFLRGDYVQLRYQISTVRLDALAGTP